jgi:flagellar hook-basal body complex protein FliE
MNPVSGDLGIPVRGLDLAPAPERAGQPAGGASFQDILEGMIDRVDSLQKDADASIQGLIAGDGVDIHNVAVKMNEAEVAFDLMMEVRNKLLDAYRDIIRMQS